MPVSDPSANGNVHTMAVQADGRSSGRRLTFLVPNGVFPPTIRNFVARLNADGTLDNGLDPNRQRHGGQRIPAGDGRSSWRILSSLQPNGAASATSRSRLPA